MTTTLNYEPKAGQSHSILGILSLVMIFLKIPAVVICLFFSSILVRSVRSSNPGEPGDNVFFLMLISLSSLAAATIWFTGLLLGICGLYRANVHKILPRVGVWCHVAILAVTAAGACLVWLFVK